MRSPIIWFGGKGLMVAKLMKYVPPHKTYCEVFGGGASLLFKKPPAPVEIYNDLNDGLVNLFRVLRNPEQFKEFHKLACLTPYSRSEYNYCRKHLYDDEDPVKHAHRWFVVARQSFSGHFAQSWGYVVTASNRGMATTVSNWLSAVERLPEIHERLSRVQIENNDFRRVIAAYDTQETFFYLDPPYLHSTRRHGGYLHEMTDKDHEDLVNILKTIKGKVMLSGYPNDLYDSLGWNMVSFDVDCKAEKAKNKEKRSRRTECIWMNYERGD